MAFFSEAGLTTVGWKEHEKMHLCSVCGLSLIWNEEHKTYVCPKGHGEWKHGVISTQVYHYNQSGSSLGGGRGSGKSAGKSRSRKKPKKKQTAVSKKYLDPFP